MADRQPPRLFLSALLRKPYIVTRYTETDGGLVKAGEKHDCTDDFVSVICGLHISESARDEVAGALGYSRKLEASDG